MAAFKYAILLYVGHLSLEFFCFSHSPIFCFKQLGFKNYVCFWAFWLRSSVVFKYALQFFFLYLFTLFLFIAVWIRVYIVNLPQFIYTFYQIASGKIYSRLATVYFHSQPPPILGTGRYSEFQTKGTFCAEAWEQWRTAFDWGIKICGPEWFEQNQKRNGEEKRLRGN